MIPLLKAGIHSVCKHNVDNTMKMQLAFYVLSFLSHADEQSRR